MNRPGYNICRYWTNFWQSIVNLQQNILEKLLNKFVVKIFTLLLAHFATKLLNYSRRHSECLNILKKSEIDDILLW